ncbi:MULTISPECIES: DUF4169 family protein [Nguyenibacter]|uniref:DUF4169 family protein n=1 Tax=Nguyenibacter vanlangensis TaxID=1216886 RepID=A0ABZ3D7T9_9PROT|nr:DUF4169 family protein [Nguyenibacter sp. L1]WRH88327.1 DUF4169 family protein [Nguyenibacter sp. L1]
MSNVVNLRRERKRRDRQQKAAVAAENRALHGRTRGARDLQRQQAEHLARTLDGARRDDAPDAPGQD